MTLILAVALTAGIFWHFLKFDQAPGARRVFPEDGAYSGERRSLDEFHHEDHSPFLDTGAGKPSTPVCRGAKALTFPQSSMRASFFLFFPLVRFYVRLF